MKEAEEFFVGTEHPMFVQKWPAEGAGSISRGNVVLVPGGLHTGVGWTETPDGREGWALQFARAGWSTFVVDWPGTGRSHIKGGPTGAGVGPVIDALAYLFRQLQPATVIGHSIGAPLVAKALDVAPNSAASFVALAPSAPGNVLRDESLLDLNALFTLTDTEFRRTMANSDRFPHDFFDAYLQTTCTFDPAIENACGDSDHSGELVVRDVAALTALPSLVIASEQDVLTPWPDSLEVSEFLRAEFVLLGRDWGMDGFGHMIPIELGSEEVCNRIIGWLEGALKPVV